MMLTTILATIVFATLVQSTHDRVVPIVRAIQRADFHGDRNALKRLHDELGPFIGDEAVGTKVLYWRGFAQWRRALNAFNESTDRKEIEDSLTACIDNFERALSRDAMFVDAKAGAAACQVNLSFLYLKDEGINGQRTRELFTRAMRNIDGALKAAPDNPRVLWVHGANQFYNPSDRKAGQAAALQTYQRALELARRQRNATSDSLDPAWGEAELLMNLAFAHLNSTPAALDAAEQHARAALALVPDWHYVRDLLLPQIQARRKR